MSFRLQMRYMNPYDIHKTIINDYILKKPGDTKLLRRDTSRDKTDFDVIKENHKFLWDDDAPDTWEAQFAKKYYDKLFKEYCIGDLSRYKENKIALRWRTEQEVVIGKGQFICANKKCNDEENLRTWEVNFAYQEHGEKKNALVKIRLCTDCSLKLNFYSKKREIKRLKSKTDGKIRQKKKADKNNINLDEAQSVSSESRNVDIHEAEDVEVTENVASESPWEKHKPTESKTRDEEMEEYLQDLLL